METKYQEITKVITWCVFGIIVLLVIGLLTGCKTKKIVEKSDTQDSIHIEYREKIIKVPVTVYVEIPAEEKERLSKDSISHLETSFAVSDAKMIWIDGVAFLNHTLANKPQKIEKKDTANVKEKEKIVWKTRRVTYNKTEIQYVAKPLAWWQHGLMWIGGFSICAIIAFIFFKIKKFLPF